ncbi:hypothetical protein FEH12_15185 [Escherichia coli]|nr:hypothetical protein [Escherichia coli]
MQFFVYIYKTARVMRVSGLPSRAKYFLLFNINTLKNNVFKYQPECNPQDIQNNPQTPLKKPAKTSLKVGAGNTENLFH